MNAAQYKIITEGTRRIVARLPGKEKCLHLPTFLCAGIYLGVLAVLFFQRDVRWIRAALVPALSFAVCTVLRLIIHRQRPYDRFAMPPVGEWKPGKGKSLPSRHAVSAVSIAIAVMYAVPNAFVWTVMIGLSILIAALRVLTGQHYPSDVAAAIALALGLAWIGYSI